VLIAKDLFVRGPDGKLRFAFDPKKQVSAQDARVITDTLASGLIGLGLFKIGQAMFGQDDDEDPNVYDNGWLRGEIITTAGGSKFVRWTVLKDVRGGMEATQFPGFAKAVLAGLTKELIWNSSLTEKQKVALFNKWEYQTTYSQPLTQGFSDIHEMLTGEKSAADVLGSRVASGTIPGGLREFGERTDEARNAVELRKAPKDAEFWERVGAQFKKKIPSPPEGSFLDGLRKFTRESLVPNIQGVPEEKRWALGASQFRYTDADWVWAHSANAGIPTNPAGRLLDKVIDAPMDQTETEREAMLIEAKKLRQIGEAVIAETRGDPLLQKVALRLAWAPYAGSLNTSAYETINKWITEAGIEDTGEFKNRAWVIADLASLEAGLEVEVDKKDESYKRLSKRAKELGMEETVSDAGVATFRVKSGE